MNPKPHTDDEILALLEDGRLAKTDFGAAISIARHHSRAIYEVRCNGTRWRVEDKEGRFPLFQERITIPRPPKRRALRGEELPEQFCTVLDRTLLETHFREDARVTPEQIQHWIDLETTWINESGKGVFYIDEPQEPLVLTTEGGE